MLSRDLKNTPWVTITLTLFLISSFYFPVLNESIAKAEPSLQKNISSPEESKPIIVYYSRSGKTRMVANELMNQLSCEITEIKSTVERSGFFGIITCVLDQLLDRDDQIEPLRKNMREYNPIIIATPIWIGKISSPARTFIKQARLQGKEVYIFLTYNGSLTEEKENTLKEVITSQGINLKALYKIVTKEKTEEEIKKDISAQMEKRPIATQKVASSTL